MITHLRERTTAFLRSRYRRGVVGGYGAGLGCDCGDCPTGPHSVPIPAPRRDAARGEPTTAATAPAS